MIVATIIGIAVVYSAMLIIIAAAWKAGTSAMITFVAVLMAAIFAAWPVPIIAAPAWSFVAARTDTAWFRRWIYTDTAVWSFTALALLCVAYGFGLRLAARWPSLVALWAMWMRKPKGNRKRQQTTAALTFAEAKKRNL